MATIEASVSSYVSATPDEVFAVLTDPPRMAEWMNGVEEAAWEPGSELRRGGQFGMKYKYRNKVSDIKMELIDVKPNSELRFKTISGPYPIEAHYVLEPSETGTNITYNQTAFSDSAMAALGFYLTSWLAKPMIRKVLRKDLEKLAAIIVEPEQPAEAAE